MSSYPTLNESPRCGDGRASAPSIPAPRSYEEALERAKKTGEKLFVFVDGSGRFFGNARNKVDEAHRVDDAAAAARLGIQGPALVVIQGGKVSVADNLTAADLDAGSRVVKAERFRPLGSAPRVPAAPPTDGYDARGGRPVANADRECPGGNCNRLPEPGGSSGVRIRPPAPTRRPTEAEARSDAENLETLTARWSPRGKREDGTLIPGALTGTRQREAAAALLKQPASEVTAAMIQDLYERATTPLGTLRADAAAGLARSREAVLGAAEARRLLDDARVPPPARVVPPLPEPKPADPKPTAPVAPPPDAGASARREVGANGQWTRDFEQAKELARKTGRPILVAFTGKNGDGSFWCGPCQNLDRSAYASDGFKRWAADNAILLEVDVPHDFRDSAGLVARYGIGGVPSIRFLDANGNRRSDVRLDGSQPWMRAMQGFQG